jgi:hypothetical protein
MKKINFHLTAFVFALLIAGFAPVVNAQVVEDDWMYNEWDLDELPSSLKSAETPEIAVAPNPSVGEYLTVFYNRVTEASEIMVYSTLGSLIYVAKVGDERDTFGSHQFSTANLATGLYIVKLKSGLYESIQKVLVQR